MEVPTKLMTADEFWDFVETADPNVAYELVQGALRSMSPSSSPINSHIAARLIHFIMSHLDETGIGGFVTAPDGGFEIMPGTVRIPDVAYISPQTAPQLEMRMQVAPDFVIEVISPSERHTAIREKISDYLDAGVRLVWNVYPETQTIDVWQRDADGSHRVQKFTSDSTVTGAPLLPNWQLSVAELFG